MKPPANSAVAAEQRSLAAFAALSVQGRGISSSMGLPMVPAGRLWHGDRDGWDDSTQQGSLPPGTGDEAPGFAPSVLPSTCLMPCSGYQTHMQKFFLIKFQRSARVPTLRTGGRRPATHRCTQIILLSAQGGPKEPKHQALHGRR